MCQNIRAWFRQHNFAFSTASTIVCTKKSTCLQLGFADSDALDPGVIKLCVPVISTILEPSTTTSAAAEVAGFASESTLGTTVAAAHRGYTHRWRRW